MSEMVERVYIAMINEIGLDCGDIDSVHAAAEAAIKVMREPTDVMIWAAGVHCSSPLRSKDELADCYQAMIDTALKEN